MENVGAEIDTVSGLQYGVNYGLGDICDVALNSVGLTWKARITEVEFIYEAGALQITPRFGDDFMTLREIIKREVNR